MERRTVLKALAAIPLLGWLVELVVPVAPTYLTQTVNFRQKCDGPNLFDDGVDTSIGAEWQSFHEVWEARDGRDIRMLSQRPGRKYRIVSRGERHSWTFSDYNIDRFACDDPNAIHLQDVADEYSSS
jgi:hypothetical protein